MPLKLLEKQFTFRSKLESKVYEACQYFDLAPEVNLTVGFYEVDLAFTKEKIAFEIDGKNYHSSNEQKAHDSRKNTYLENRGWKVKRYPGWMAYKYPKLLGAEYVLRYMTSPTEEQKEKAITTMTFFMANQADNEAGLEMLSSIDTTI